MLERARQLSEGLAAHAGQPEQEEYFKKLLENTNHMNAKRRFLEPGLAR